MSSLFTTFGNKYSGIICLCVITVIIIAGLWPFNFIPGNKVERLQNDNGIRFYGQGIVFSPEPINIRKTAYLNSSITIELFIRPHRVSHSMMSSLLTLYDRDRENILIGQWIKELFIRVPCDPSINIEHPKRYCEISIENALEEDTTHLISLTSGNGSTAIYIDGSLMNSFPNFSLLSDERRLSGQLVLGNSPDGRHTWNGTFLGLAIYDQTLDDKEILINYRSWHKYGHPLFLIRQIKPIVLYLFDEHFGAQIRDHSGSGINLLIPAIFQPFRRTILGMPRKDQWFSHWNIIDVSVNILGFLPFGFFLFAWLQQTKNLTTSHSYFFSILLGACISLAIELVQAYLPTRDSSLLDIFSNILGTVVGVLLFKYAFPFLNKSKGDPILLS